MSVQTESKHPLHPVRRPDLLQRVRALVAALPETSEKVAWGCPTFRVGPTQKMFAMFNDDHHGDDRISLWCKAAPGLQEILVHAASERFFRPPYVGVNGWIGVFLDVEDVDWEELAHLLRDAWRMTAPRKILAAHGVDNTAPVKKKSPGRKRPAATKTRLE